MYSLLLQHYTKHLNLRKNLVKCYICSTALYDAETWTLWKLDQKHLESFEMWCWRRMEKISWADRVRNEELLHGFKGERSVRHRIREGRLAGLVRAAL
jgi:hypothetical protein